MTCYREGWDLYAASLLMTATTRNYEDQILNESVYVMVELFKFEDPEKAYQSISGMIRDGNYSDRFREDGNIIELKCLGLYDLDLLQTNLDEIKQHFEGDWHYGVDIASVNLDHIGSGLSGLIKKKEDLSLFGGNQ